MGKYFEWIIESITTHSIHQNIYWATEKITQSVKCILYKHEDLSLDPQCPLKKKPGMKVPLSTRPGKEESDGIPRAHKPASLAKILSQKLSWKLIMEHTQHQHLIY